METKFFVYQNADKVLSAQRVINFTDKGNYLTGFSLTDKGPRTFRYDRVIELVGSETELMERFGYWQINEVINPHKSQKIEIHFTGFKAADKARLEETAEEAGMQVNSSMSDYVEVLCCGYNAGPKKLEKARANHIIIISEPEFMQLLETGEIPSLAV